MESPSNNKNRVLRETPPWLSESIFCAVCGLLVGIFAWFSDTTTPLESVYSNVNEADYNLLAQGFSAGQLNLKEDPPPGLAKLSDPYDPNLNGPYIGTVNDLTYYKGKLYLYFGVTPALVFFWPYHALTGQYTSEKAAIAFFMGIGFAAIAGILRAVRRRYFPAAGKWIATAGTIIPGLALALTLSVSDHETAITCGFAFAMLALAAVWAALHETKARALWLALASLAYGLAIAARPTLLFGAAILLLPVLQAWRLVVAQRVSPVRQMPIGDERAGRADLPVRQTGSLRIPALLFAAIGPIAFIGLALMLYNFLRFDSPFEFGWRYQLNSSYRATSAHPFGLNYLWLNFRLYFLEPVIWSGHFPFLKSLRLPPMPPGYDLGNAYAGGGILILYPIVFFAIAAPLAWKQKLQGAGSALSWFAAACLLVFLAGTVTLSLFFASAGRYELDFLPGLLLLAIIGALCADHAALPFPGRRRLICIGLFVLMCFSVAINFLANVEARAEADYFVGNYYLSQGRFDDAQAQYQKALTLFPDCADGHSGLGDLRLKQGRMDEAIIEYQKALEISPNLVEAHNNLGHCLLHTGRVDDAIAQFEIAVQMRPRSVNYRNAFGAACARKGLWSEAIIQFKASIEIEPDLPEPHNDLGYCFLQTGQTDEAIAEHRTAVRLEPDSASYLDALANALCQKGLFDEAALEYKKALELRPDYSEAYNNLGYCLQQTGHTDEAIVQYQKAIHFQPGSGEAYFNLGNAYREKKLAAQATTAYEKAIQLAPEFLPAQLNLAWMLATWPDAGVRNGDKAVALAKHLNDMGQGSDPKILRALAAAYAEEGRFAEASSAAKQALALASAQSQAALTNALQKELSLYSAHSPARSTGSF